LEVLFSSWAFSFTLDNKRDWICLPVAGHFPDTNQLLYHHLLRPCRPGEIIFVHRQITLLSDPWSVAVF
jgi:hypothetical protein